MCPSPLGWPNGERRNATPGRTLRTVIVEQQTDVLRIRAGARFDFTTTQPVASVFVIRPEGDLAQATLAERWSTNPDVAYRDYTDVYGNICRRTTLPAGNFTLDYDVIVEVSGALDSFAPDACEHPAAEIPDDALMFTLPSRYCLSDVLYPQALELFGAVEPGWARVQAIVDWVHEHITFGYGSSSPETTAVDVYANRRGVCRDFAHLAVTFCRAMNVPARYAFGYLPDIDVPPPYAAMDFCAWFEAYLGGRWWIFDPRNNQRRRGRVTIARGRDALDVAMVTTFGAARLNEMTVRADPTDDDAQTFNR